MKALRWLSGFVVLAVAVISGIFLLLPPCADVCPAAAALAANKAYRIAAGAVILAMCVLFMAALMSSGKKRRFISFENEGGAINVSVQAVTDYLSRIADEFAGIEHIDADIVSKEEPLDITLDLKVKSGANIPELCALVQERVRSGLSSHLGISEIKSVRINVLEIVGGRGEKVPEQPERPDWPNA